MTFVEGATLFQKITHRKRSHTIEKAKVDGLQARLFSRLRRQHQDRERLRLSVSYRRRFLDALSPQRASPASAMPETQDAHGLSRCVRAVDDEPGAVRKKTRA